ncbi:MAG: bifunctional 4-hydroxy-2-oxoglutarate aldolase/2-dehydro-3-deoxy-phosphogluconate aldolase [Spirochaetia bacterium]|jgi:2-dehydro-3-deoxyphosphogluconate aldolase/(4S)-4-hydroxy-2-oxoglutarate aldolase
MHDILKKLGEIGVIPVVKIEKACDAVNLGKALLAGELPVAEITFRTAAAEEAIKNMTLELPHLLVGAGTVLNVEQVRKAVGAGARFIVAPGFNPKVVDYCIGQGIPVTPGISSPSEIEMALERGLEVLKFFPAGASGGLDFLKAIAAPYGSVQFIPTGGVDPSNLGQYLSNDRVLAVGGTWIAKEAAIGTGKFDEITRLAREAVAISLGFEFAHLGINKESPEAAAADAETFARLFSFPTKDGASSVFSASCIEIVKTRYLGDHGHIGISTLSIPRAIAYLSRKGVGIRPETNKEKNGKLVAVYLDQEIAGFAIHLLQK